MPTVSVVVPTFARPAFLRQALASLSAQTWSDLEILVCDNGGDSATRGVVDAAGDPRIRHLVRPHDLGMMRNAIDGFRAATGEFALKLDDDDTWAPDAVTRLVAPLLRDEAITLAFAPFTLVDAAGHPLPAATRENERISGRAHLAPGRHAPFTALASSGAASLTSAILRRSAVDWNDVPAGVSTAYDRHIVLQAARGGAAAWFEPTPLVAYRIHPGSDTSTATLRQALGSLAAVEHALDSRQHPDAAALVPGAQEGAVTAARLLLREGRTVEARGVLARAARRGVDAELARLGMVSTLPAPLAAKLTRQRFARYLTHATSATHPE